MADNPHNIEKDLRGEDLSTLTGKLEGNAVDKIVQLKYDFATGNSQNLHQIEKAIKQYNKTLASFVGDDSVRSASETFFTSSLNAGYLPSSITGFFDNVTNEALYDFYNQGTDDLQTYLYGFRKINPDYTGYACRIRRQYDLAEADVKFNSDGFVATDSEVVLFGNGFGTGLRDTELTFSGFCCPSYLNSGLKDSIYATTTVTQLHNQGGASTNLTGDVNSRTTTTRTQAPIARTESLTLDISDTTNTTYGELMETVDFNNLGGGSNQTWVPVSGTGIVIDGEEIQFPIYGSVSAGGFNVRTLYPTRSAQGVSEADGRLRWQFREGSSMGGIDYVDNVQLAATTFDLGDGFSNQTITGSSTNRPTEFTSWTIKDGSFPSSFDTTSTCTWGQAVLNNQPIVATGASDLMLDNGKPCMEFKKEGNHGVLHHEGNFLSFISSKPRFTFTFVSELNTTGSDVILMNEGTADGEVEGEGTQLDGACIAYGLHTVSSTRSWKAFLAGRNDGVGEHIFRTSNSDYVNNGITDSGNNLNKNLIILSHQSENTADYDNNTGEFIYNGVKQRAINVSNGQQPLNQSTMHFGSRLDANGDLTEGFNGKLYEVHFYDEDAQMDSDELNRFTGDINNFYNIT